MKFRQMGSSGLRVSVIGLGTNRFGQQVEQAEVNRIMDVAIERGLNFIDTADVYTKGNSESSLGVALKGKWDKVVLATKGFNATGEGTNDRGSSRYHLLNAVENSLRRLQSDHIDLYQMHRWDDSTPIQETMRTLEDLVRSGKVRYIGASQYAAWQLAKANMLAEMRHWTAFATIQSHYHMLEREVEKEVLPYCREDNIGFIPYFPLAGGFLTGKYKRGEAAPVGSRGESSEYVQGYMTDKNYTIVEQLTAWAEAHQHTMAELAHAWLLAQPQVCSVISGVTRLEQLEANLLAGDWELSTAELAEVNEILTQ
jgi:aryl-alcohol dehydrogenase-like predicted oxidoreductase